MNQFVLVVLVAAALAAGPCLAADEDDSPAKSSKLGEARVAIEAGRFERAIGYLDEANQESPDNADVFNLLGFSHRKLGRFDEALGYYQKALAIDPEHRGANEYLGELYLETDQLEKARERLEVLDGACFFTCEEYEDLKAAIEVYSRKKGS